MTQGLLAGLAVSTFFIVIGYTVGRVRGYSFGHTDGWNMAHRLLLAAEKEKPVKLPVRSGPPLEFDAHGELGADEEKEKP